MNPPIAAARRTNMKRWLITGSSSGLGRALAEAALQAGHEVVATARNPAALEPLARSERCQVAALDVTDPASVRAALAQAGAVDVLVNNAGCGLVGALEECAESEIRSVFETNFFGPLALIRALLPALRARRRGHLINVSAAAAIANYPGFGAYGAAKAALEAASESLRQELRPLGIHVTIVEPGPFRTDFVRRNVAPATARIDDYDGTAGNFARLIRATDGRQPGDPRARRRQSSLSRAWSSRRCASCWAATPMPRPASAPRSANRSAPPGRRWGCRPISLPPPGRPPSRGCAGGETSPAAAPRSPDRSIAPALPRSLGPVIRP
ncbi:SDR family NAD(P)-dependent oxidoreductase [Oleiharenicola sp. Vm1]|uniref:SDR family NAD(P)-dependent oxidoreductase n=1 Tax=Oleiharenicola sp. Vm1 TaxID=3398393 RepID=UPI0039F4621D